MFPRHLITFQFFAACVAVPWVASADAETQQAAVETRDGRILVGKIDERSDEQSLWLRRTEDNIVLAMPVAWDEVVSAEIGGESIDVVDLATDYAGYVTSGPKTLLTEYELVEHEQQPKWPAHGSSGLRVASVEIEAAVVNLDRTVESDGLLVALAAIDNHGQPVAVRGSLHARLIVERLDQHTGRVSFEEFQRWSAPVSVAKFHEGIIEIPLRFRRASPEFDWELCTAALLNVRLGVAGQGNFEASIPVAIHEFNPIRDEMRNQQGSRFYRDELTHRTRHDGPRNLHQGYSVPRSYGF